MGRDLLMALCLWSCILTVTGEFSNAAVRQVTEYIASNVISFIWDTPQKAAPQFSYVVKLTKDECDIRKDPCNPALITKIPEQFSRSILYERTSNLEIMKNTMNNKEIYSGERLLLATFREVTARGVTYTEHAEYRLLAANGPIQNFLNREPAAHCVIFYSLLSPCVDRCLNPTDRYKILTSLQNNFQRFPDRAFVYKHVFRNDLEKLRTDQGKNQVINAWGILNSKMPLFRCGYSACHQCFPDNNINNYCTQETPTSTLIG